MASSQQRETRRVFSMPFGARIAQKGGVFFRLWAPGAEEVALCLIAAHEQVQEFPMTRQPHGWFVLQHPSAKPGDRYLFQIDNGLLVPDPASRMQDKDIHGPSVVVRPSDFTWQDAEWQGRPWHETVLYELHVGAFSAEGTFAGVRKRLDYLLDLGITAIELMPVAQFPGRCNWGYDGALLFAPCTCYGTPNDLKELVQEAHCRGLMVFLDVVYNHFGPEGNYLHVYARDAFFSEEFHTPWGAAINYSGQKSRVVRDFFIANALYWLEEYHIDGLRLDAVHAIFDRSSPDILEEITQAVKDGPGRKRHIHLILENDNNCARYLARDQKQQPCFYTAQWNDDIHHACHTLLTSESEGYYVDYSGSPIAHLGRCLSEGFAYQGEVSQYRHGQRRGDKSGHLPPLAFVSFLQNHDQVGNRAFGERLITLCDQQELAICIALLLLAPSPPLLFMGEEFGEKNPFCFFCDFGPDLAENVTKGRREEFSEFPQFRSPESRKRIPDPNSFDTFKMSKLDWQVMDKEEHRVFLALYRQLLALRHEQIVPRLVKLAGGQAGHQVLAQKAIHAWWRLAGGVRISLLFNLHEHALALDDDRLADARLLYQKTTDDCQGRDEGLLPGKSIFWYIEEEVRYG